MLKYIIRRLVLLIPILFGLSLFIIVFVHALPGDPCSSILGAHTSPHPLIACRHGRGPDQPPNPHAPDTGPNGSHRPRRPLVLRE